MKKESMKLSLTSAMMTRTGTCQAATRASTALVRRSPRSSWRSPRFTNFTQSRATRSFPRAPARGIHSAWPISRSSWYRPLWIGTAFNSASRTLGAFPRLLQPQLTDQPRQRWAAESASSSPSTKFRHPSQHCLVILCSRAVSAKCLRSIYLYRGRFWRSQAKIRTTVRMNCVSIMILMKRSAQLPETSAAAASNLPTLTESLSWVTISQTLKGERSRLWTSKMLVVLFCEVT